MNTYQVIRPFSGYQAGDTLQESDFLSRQRADQLVSQRYVVLVVPQAEVSDEQPRKRGKKRGENESTD